MSDTPDRDTLAAEYVLGCLEGEEAEHAQHLLSTDAAFVRSVEAWQQRLTPLANAAAPVWPPTSLWDRIELAIRPPAAENVVRPSLSRRLRFWQASTAGALAIAAGLAAFILLRHSEPASIAVLTPVSAGAAPVLVATAEQSGRLLLRPEGQITVPAGRDMELWALPEGESRPRSLGVLPPGGTELSAALTPQTQLLVTLEPAGGSPTGQATGPVLYKGRLTALN